MKVVLEFDVTDENGKVNKVTKELCPVSDKAVLSKILLEFNSYEEEDLDAAVNGWRYKNRLDDIWDKLFRPRHKHGYSRKPINLLLGVYREEENLEHSHVECNQLMDMLEEIYREVVDSE